MNADLLANLPPRANQAYQVRNVIGRQSLYLNWGLWDDATPGIDEAARALVLQLGRLAGIGPAMRLLDVGFGYGDQLLDWCRDLDLRNAEGLNLCPEQTELARRRLADAGLADRVRVQVGDAVRPPFAPASFDAVTAVECAFHFASRPIFFAAAAGVLKPGGRLVLADFIKDDKPPTWRVRLAQHIADRFWGFAPGSFCSADTYRAQLEAAGFKSIVLDDVTERVIPPGMRHARQRLHEAELHRRMQPAIWWATRGALAASRALGDPLPGRYVLVQAVKS